MIKLTIINQLLLELAKLPVLIISFISVGYFIIINLLNLLLPEMTEKNIVFNIESSDLNKLVILLIFLNALTIFFFIKFKKVKLISVLSLNKKEIIIYGLTSYCLVSFIRQNLSLFVFLKDILSTILFFLIFFFFPPLVYFFSNFRIDYFRMILIKIRNDIKQIELRSINWRGLFIDFVKFIFKKLPYLIIPIFFTVVGLFFLRLIFAKINVYLLHQSFLHKQFLITRIRPKETIIAETVILDGYNFGFKENEFFQLKTSKGSVSGIKDWNNNKVEFVVPLDLPEGKNELWLERTKTASSQSALMKTNKVDLTILSRWDFYPQQKDYQYPPSFLDYFRITVKKLKRIIFFNWGVIQLCGKLINC